MQHIDFKQCQKAIILLITSALVNLQSTAQSSPTDIANKFFGIYKDAGSSQAVNFLFSTNQYSDDSKDEISNIKEKLNENSPSFGQYSGYELLSTKSGGKDLELLTFIVKFDRLPLVFKMLFYRPGAQWRIQNFTFNTNIDDILNHKMD